MTSLYNVFLYKTFYNHDLFAIILNNKREANASNQQGELLQAQPYYPFLDVKEITMKKIVFAAFLVIALAIASVSPASANSGGAPGAHGVDGKTFGAAVSGLAQSGPGAVANHVSNSGGNGGGMPAAHGVDGKTFGGAVSSLAQMYPGAVADHVSGK